MKKYTWKFYAVNKYGIPEATVSFWANNNLESFFLAQEYAAKNGHEDFDFVEEN